MAAIKWIKIATDIFDDEKILLIESMPDSDALIVIWFKLLVLAGKGNNDGVLMMNERIPYSEEMFASIFRRPLNTVRLALRTFENFGMIEIVNDVVTLPNWEKHQSIEGLDKMREQNRERQRRFREKQKQKLLPQDVTQRNVTHNEKITQDNAIEQEQDKDKELESSSCYTNVWQVIKPEEVDALSEIYVEATELIQAVYEDVKAKHRTIRDPYRYIIGYAENKQWEKLK